ncbi:LAQU0S03e00980g1_1 [Lachancea quebecensis]|uniref:LAQU0S03e00980g1_1 n=1 Tax=Lachancea quebecensis TaxID=1654605 RepID=A0A0P1KP65_9SACH|nr:LAQU0S03e00980g1_1 [Lachancea quebecensis]
MRTQLGRNSRRLITLLLVTVLAEVLYIVVSVVLVEGGRDAGLTGLARGVSGGVGAGAGRLERWLLGGSAAVFRADPNRMLPGLASGSRVRLPDRDVEFVVRGLRSGDDASSGDAGGKATAVPSARDLVNFYRLWKFDTAIRYPLPCSAAQTLFGRLQRRVESLEELFPGARGAAGDAAEGTAEGTAEDTAENAAEGADGLVAGDGAAAEDGNLQFPLRSYNYDPRLATAVYYDELMDFLARQEVHDPQSLFSNLSVPFNWYDWTDSQLLNGFIDLPPAEKPGCDMVVRKYYPADKVLAFERRFGYKLFEEDRERGLGSAKFDSVSSFSSSTPRLPRPEELCDTDQANALLPGFRVREPLNFSRPELYGLQARAALMTTAKPPNSITFLNRNGSAFQVEVDESAPLDPAGVPRGLLFNGLLRSYLRRNVPSFPEPPAQDIEFDNIQKFQELKKVAAKALARSSAEPAEPAEPVEPVEPVEPTEPANPTEMPYLIEMSGDEFEFDAKAKIRELEALETRSRHQQSYLESLKFSINTHPMHLAKYFTEASHVSDYTHLGHHFDARFFRGGVEHNDMRARLDALVRAWLNFVHSNGLNSWLSHGTLYGWLYDGLAFPWDGDHDMQMPIVHLNKLAEKFNQTLIVEDPEVGNGRFFLDVTSSITSRIHGNNNNNIDARFIDVDSGLYVDITGLSVSSDGARNRFDPLIKNLTSNHNISALTHFKDPNLVEGVTGLSYEEMVELEKKQYGNFTKQREHVLKSYFNTVNSRQFGKEKETPDYRYNINKHIQVYNCRNNHFSHLSELSPLRLTFFHGAKAYVPNRVIENLKNEYKVPSNYSYIEFQGRSFVPEFRLWMNKGALERMAQDAGVPTRVDTNHLQNLDFPETASLFQNAAVLADSEVEEVFNLATNTFHMSIFRQKELELTYDESLSPDKKVDALREFVNNRAFTGGYKDPFQQRLETVVWYNLLDRSTISYKQLDRELKKAHLDNSDKLLELNDLMTRREYDWAREAGHQYPPSDLDFNELGRRFFAIGENSHNQIFDADPPELIQEWTTI